MSGSTPTVYWFEEQTLRGFYVNLLSFSAASPALNGQFTDLHKSNLNSTKNYDEYLFSFARWNDKEKLVIVSNFSASNEYQIDLQIPDHLISDWQLINRNYQLVDVLSSESHSMNIRQGQATIQTSLNPLQSKIFQPKRL
jgi:hypothetical protein